MSSAHIHAVLRTHTHTRDRSSRSTTIRLASSPLDTKPLPLLPYMTNPPLPKPKRTVKPEERISPEAYRDILEGYLWEVGRCWQGYLGDPNPYCCAREWAEEGRALGSLWEVIWAEGQGEGEVEGGMF